MFDVAPSELLLVAVVALVVIGPKDLPRAMRVVGRWLGKARKLSRHFRSGIDEMIRQSEMEDMEKRWAEENAKLLAENQGQGNQTASTSSPATPSPVSDDPAEQNIVFTSPADLEVNTADTSHLAANHTETTATTAASTPAKPKEADQQEKQS
ncbi:twin-arginine translocase subunit TatB [Zymomonas mobilis subsp. mobilis ZM4 = ATCC 31821]|uniref:Sec-independent protein translocase protein TatB n=2 Tax=Zymomonas mobilis TaxID=542 RepID=TATB_ZYMMO|nr:Sec-independent protein translocase protein TatB [Zymomonas mobilis]Q5NN67.2 RecName: Full=Sec-independent protein translocase protein TatB [Zymomonas mobilis subsp. mobilis ZM4 = ATCC 31821]AAV89843.2 twin-arginine translocation protein, TatB subunit [Zymomonas mobilis subsp. mobilis ZM4 = ATCC 31821]AVZ26098.1 twin-arginine translocase subunit TatB [Zymomonas mobilis subsp. mobilis]AVZ27989.1 twin-arginine translocase subunit TatB [Zymomonas mobilis subsp. mobilis]AVZ42436.1 twin-arginine